jgi:hypothetical protein
MSAALQMPYRERPAKEVGPRIFRKQILRTGRVPYEGKELVFDLAYLEHAVAAFKAGAYDQVPFVLADWANRHSSDPERFRGEVKALELVGDGIDALIELTEDGAEVVRKNPRLGVSARLVSDPTEDGRFPVAIEHVCGTLNPRVNGLRPWETDSVRSLTQSSQYEVIDLSSARYMADPTFTDQHLAKLNELPEDQRDRVTALLEGKAEPTSAEVTTEGDEKKPSALKRLLGIGKDSEVSEEDIDEAIGKILDESEEEETTTEHQPVTSLSKDEREAIDLARSEAKSARDEADKLRRDLAEKDWQTERKDFSLAGVPKACLDLAEPLMKNGPKQVIDLTNGDKADAAAIVRGLLAQLKGRVDLTGPLGSAEGEEDDQRTQAREQAKTWKENPA